MKDQSSVDRSRPQSLSADNLTALLAERILGWKAAPGRFIKSDRGWTPRWRFAPLTNLEAAFKLLDASASGYTLVTNTDGCFKAEVRVDGRVGKAFGEPKARAITIALGRALGLEIPDEIGVPVSMPAHRRGPRSRRKIDGI
jgi:hypothetical protein